MLYCCPMSTVTIPKTKYESLKKQAAAYRRILSAPREMLCTLSHTPNKETRAAIRELERGGGKRFNSVDELFEDALGKNWRKKVQ